MQKCLIAFFNTNSWFQRRHPVRGRQESLSKCNTVDVSRSRCNTVDVCGRDKKVCLTRVLRETRHQSFYLVFTITTLRFVLERASSLASSRLHTGPYYTHMVIGNTFFDNIQCLRAVVRSCYSEPRRSGAARVRTWHTHKYNLEILTKVHNVTIFFSLCALQLFSGKLRKQFRYKNIQNDMVG